MDAAADCVLPCSHQFCHDCLTSWNARNDSCPLCREQGSTGADDVWVLAAPPTNEEVYHYFSDFIKSLA